MDLNFRFVFKQLLDDLANPTLDSDALKQTFHFIKNDLFQLYSDNKTIIDGIDYFNNLHNDIINNDSSKEKIYGLVLIVDKYFCLNDTNKEFIKSEFTILQFLTKATFYQILQRIYYLSLEKHLTLDNYTIAIDLFKSTIGDTITSAKGYQLNEIINNQF